MRINETFVRRHITARHKVAMYQKQFLLPLCDSCTVATFSLVIGEMGIIIPIPQRLVQGLNKSSLTTSTGLDTQVDGQYVLNLFSFVYRLKRTIIAASNI